MFPNKGPQGPPQTTSTIWRSSRWPFSTSGPQNPQGWAGAQPKFFPGAGGIQKPKEGGGELDFKYFQSGKDWPMAFNLNIVDIFKKIKI